MWCYTVERSVCCRWRECRARVVEFTRTPRASGCGRMMRWVTLLQSRWDQSSHILLFLGNIAEKISTWFPLHTTVLCLSQIALKFGLHRSTPTSSNCAPKWPAPVDLSIRDNRWQIAAEWLEIAQWSRWEPIENHWNFFEWCYSWPFHHNGVPNAPMTNFAMRAATWRIR